MKRLVAIIVLCLILCLLFAGCGGETSSSGNLPVTKLQDILNQEVATSGVPGIIAGVQTPNGTWTGAAGVANTATGALMTPDMQVRLASITKTLTAVLVMKMVEKERLSLDDTVGYWLPGQVPGGDKMTIKMLLNHSAGVFDVGTDSFWQSVYADPTRDWSNSDVLSLLNPGNTPAFTPGTKYSYSNTGYYVLGAILEAATGTTVSDLFQQHIATPAGMIRTTLTRQGYLLPPNEHGYAWLPTTEAVSDTTNWNLSWDWTAGSGCSTADDMLKFAHALFNGQILSPTTVALMISPSSFAPDSHYGLGLAVSLKDNPKNVFHATTIGHSGANPGTATSWYYFPDYDITIFVAVNRMDTPAPDGTIYLDGTAASRDALKKIWDAVKPLIAR